MVACSAVCSGGASLASPPRVLPAAARTQLAVSSRHFVSTPLFFRSFDTVGCKHRFLRLVKPNPKKSSSNPQLCRKAINLFNSASAFSISGTVREQYTSFRCWFLWCCQCKVKSLSMGSLERFWSKKCEGYHLIGNNQRQKWHGLACPWRHFQYAMALFKVEFIHCSTVFNAQRFVRLPEHPEPSSGHTCSGIVQDRFYHRGNEPLIRQCWN